MTRKHVLFFGFIIILMTALSARFFGKQAATSVDRTSPSSSSASPVKKPEAESEAKAGATPEVASAGEEQPKAVLKKVHPNGTRVYQIDRTQVTVTPDGEVFYLPEEI